MLRTSVGKNLDSPYLSRVNWETRDVGWPILLPWSVYYFSPYPGPKYHIHVFESDVKVALSARIW